ncbi:MAG: hypothetical protein KFF50_09410, partial [Desulfatitalea sp.]|nr:hypothetical protein [Desulfatitalea sp.]
MHSNEPHTEPSFQPLVQQVLAALAGTYKKRNLYVASHTVYQNALDALIQLFDALLHQTERLKLNVEQDRILYDGAAVYEGATEPTDLAFILHRDGLISITFREGLQRWELDTLIT